MRVSYIHATPAPVAEANTVHVMRMCQAMAAVGHEVELLVPGGGDKGVADVFGHYGVRPNFSLVRPWPSIDHPLGSRAFATAAVLRSIIAEADLIYTRNVMVADVATAVGRPTVLELHIPPASVTSSTGPRLLRIFRRPSLKRFVVISEALKQLFLSQLDATRLAERIAVAHDGADLAPSAPRNDGPFTAVYAGSFYLGRGVELVLALAGQLPDVRFRLVGGSPEALADLAGRAGPNVELIGYRPPSEIPQILSAADVLLAPYQRVVMLGSGDLDTSAFMSPLKIFEYMAAGRAIVASDLPVLKEVLADRATALLCDPDSLEDWRRAVVSLRDDQELRERLGGAARKLLSDHYTWDHRAKRVLSGLSLDSRAAIANAADEGLSAE